MEIIIILFVVLSILGGIIYVIVAETTGMSMGEMIEAVLDCFPVIEYVNDFCENVSDGERSISGGLMLLTMAITFGLCVWGIHLLSELGFDIWAVEYEPAVIWNEVASIVAIVGINICSKANKFIGILVCVIAFILIIKGISKGKKTVGAVRAFWGSLLYQIGLFLLPCALIYLVASIIVILAFIVIIKFFPLPNISTGDIKHDDGITKNLAEEKEKRRREVQEDLHMATGVDKSDIHVNSDGTKYSIGSSDWNSVSRDAKSFEDSKGDWHNFYK